MSRKRSANRKDWSSGSVEYNMPTMEAITSTIVNKPGILACHAAREVGIPKQRIGDMLALMEYSGTMLYEDERGGLYYYGRRAE